MVIREQPTIQFLQMLDCGVDFFWGAMSSLTTSDIIVFEKLFDLASGFVLLFLQIKRLQIFLREKGGLKRKVNTNQTG